MVLGVGGFRLLRVLGYEDIPRFHMNEWRAALLVLALGEEKLASQNQSDSMSNELIETIRGQCVFTTHTLVPAGHDKFPEKLACQVQGDRWWAILKACGVEETLTNGVHAVTWTAPSFQKLFDSLLPDWRRDQLSLRYVVGLPTSDIWETHVEAKRTWLSI